MGAILTEDVRFKIALLSKAENLDRMEKSIVNKGLSVIKKATKQNLKSDFPQAFRRNPKYSDTMADAIMSSVQPWGDEMVGKVHVLGKKTTTSGTFRLRFFEQGTEARYKKSGAYSGHIEPLYFFQSAVESTGDEVELVMQQEFDKQIDKIIG